MTRVHVLPGAMGGIKTWGWCVAFTLLGAPAMARPGAYLGLGIGGSGVNGAEVSTGNFGASNLEQPPGNPNLLSTDIGGGASTVLTLGYNILGYGALETTVGGHAHHLGDETARAWAAHWHVGARIYPMWYWQNRLPKWLQPVEPSIFAGWGLSYQGYNPDTGGYSEVAWKTWKSLKVGAGLEYHFPTYVKIGINYDYIHAPFDTFVFNASGQNTYELTRPATTGFHQVVGSVSMHLDWG